LHPDDNGFSGGFLRLLLDLQNCFSQLHNNHFADGDLVLTTVKSHPQKNTPPISAIGGAYRARCV
jgi:hypothetical protein